MIYLEVGRVACPRRLVQNPENYPHYRFDAIYGTTHRSFPTGFMQKIQHNLHKRKKTFRFRKVFWNYTLKTEQSGRGKKKALGKTEEKVFKL